jgi:hypothetical protein
MNQLCLDGNKRLALTATTCPEHCQRTRRTQRSKLLLTKITWDASNWQKWTPVKWLQDWSIMDWNTTGSEANWNRTTSKFPIVNFYWLYSVTNIYNIILVDDTLGPLVRINNIQYSSCTQLQKRNQTKNQSTQMVHYKRWDRGRQSKNHCILIKQNGKKVWASVTFMAS